eukprot:1157249-Pelagomonas_calceolata.AAC.9
MLVTAPVAPYTLLALLKAAPPDVTLQLLTYHSNSVRTSQTHNARKPLELEQNSDHCRAFH